MKKLMIAGLMLAAATTPASAWGPLGHRVTGALAERYLSADAKAAVEALLGVETLAEASTWPDEQRSNPDEFWQKQATPWHYVTMPEGTDYDASMAPPQGDAMTALATFTATLKDKSASLADRQRALRFIVHIVGDLHQPMHTGDGSDRGGNDVKVMWFEKPSNLHMVWDEDMLNHQGLSYTEMSTWLAARITPEKVQAWTVTDPKVWIKESATLRPGVYPSNQMLSWQYGYDHIGTAKERLSMAGVRIAAYLNEVFRK
ncbi:S1/P1 nuclease [Gimibacter soli]|uniref:S1/P1 nuclease n=1 Tax=Gimibacter soli TaxID=3024400 RepID=A0AAE9XS07_9PROT|nr:S1/P1 nuclease [Gimibacter soli]WCL53905.1 S1/P1 nuclease [Gimibacter soli]